MKKRKISFRQVLECLRKGVISESAHLNIEGDWKATLAHQYAGDAVKVAVVIEKQENGDAAVVVTVMDGPITRRAHETWIPLHGEWAVQRLASEWLHSS
jgi:hypothetical protein